MGGQGPSMESWARDHHDLGREHNLPVQNKNEHDNIDEFKDLFATAKVGIKKTSPRNKKGIELVYNPGQLLQQQQPVA